MIHKLFFQKGRIMSAVLLSLLLIFPMKIFAQQQGAGAFLTEFNETANDFRYVNAYLLAYLSTVMYPEHLARLAGKSGDGDYIRKLHSEPQTFEQEFARLTRFLFTSPVTPRDTRLRHSPSTPLGSRSLEALAYPKFRYHTRTWDGYDPEAMVIATQEAIYIIFRGTDRVAAYPSGSFEYEWREWLKTDLDFRATTTGPGYGLPGMVHLGFWNSLGLIAEDLFQNINELDPHKTKKLWISGHSLGAAHAQLFAAYVARKGRKAQGVYVYAAPHVGNQQFVNYLNTQYGPRLQRFDFAEDPVTMVPPYTFGYQRAGIRNYFDDLDHLKRNAPERSPAEVLNVLAGITGAGADVVAEMLTREGKIRFSFEGPSPLCFHHPQWYLNATWRRVKQTTRSRLPAPFPLPTSDADACNQTMIARGQSNPIHDVVETITYNIEQLFANVSGTAVREGRYYIRCYKGRKYLDVDGPCVGKNGCKVQLWSLGQSPKNNIFRISKTLAGYQIVNEGKALEVKFQERGALHQEWHFYKGSGNKYVIRNVLTGKVLDATDSCTDQNGCSVRQRSPKNNDATQVWILERIGD